MLEIKWKPMETEDGNNVNENVLVPYVRVGDTYFKIENVELINKTLDLKSKVYVGTEEYQGCIGYEAETCVEAIDMFNDIVRDLRLYVDTSNYARRVYIDSHLCVIDHNIIGWKKCYLADGHKCLVKMLIPKGTRCNLTIAKCRSEHAEILGVYSMSYSGFPVRLPDDTVAYSIYAVAEIMRRYEVTFSKAIRAIDTRQYDSPELLTRYSVGSTYTEDMFETSTRECAPGIHFFRSIDLARDYIV